MDKATGKFTTSAFSAAEKSRYSNVAAQNAAKSSASSGAPKPSSPTPAASPPKPAIGMLGKTSFERRTPTSAELSAARGAAAGSTPEQRLQAAQKTNLPTTGPSVDLATARSSVASDVAKANSPAVINRPAPQKSKPPTPGKGIMQNQSYEWPSAKTIRDIAGAYSSIYEGKGDGNLANNYPPYDKVTRGDVIAGALGKDQEGGKKKKKVTKKEVEIVDEKYMGFKKLKASIAAKGGVRDPGAVAASIGRKKYGKEKFQKAAATDHKLGEELELWVNSLIEEGYDLSGYTWDDVYEIYLDEATRMRKELGQEGEIATRKELARRSNAYQRSGSVDKTIAAAERGANSPYVKNVSGESDANRAARERTQSQTLSGLAASRRGSVRDKPRAGLRSYAADVKGSDKELQNARSSARVAGTLTPREKKMLNKEAYEAYEFVASYLLENNFASTVEDADVIINNMSEGWFNQIIEG